MIAADLAVLLASLAVSTWASQPPKRVAPKPQLTWLEKRAAYEKAQREHRGQAETFEALKSATNDRLRETME